MTEVLLLPEKFHAAIIAQLQCAYPLEACGIMAGLKGCVQRVYAVDNKLRSPVAFEMDPQQQLQAILDLEEAGLALLAIYHSHPTGPETPSPTDVAHCYYPEVVHIIVSLLEPQQPVTRAFTIGDGQFREVALKIV